MQRIENGHSFRIQPDHLSVDNRGTLNARRGFNDHRIAFRPICSVDCVQTHPPIANMDLEPVTVMLQLVRPARSGWRLLGDDWLARMNKAAGAFNGLPRALRTRCNIPENINRFIEIATVLSSPGPCVNWGIRRRRDDMLRTLGTVTLLTLAVVIPFKEAAAQDPLGGAILWGCDR